MGPYICYGLLAGAALHSGFLSGWSIFSQMDHLTALEKVLFAAWGVLTTLFAITGVLVVRAGLRRIPETRQRRLAVVATAAGMWAFGSARVEFVVVPLSLTVRLQAGEALIGLNIVPMCLLWWFLASPSMAPPEDGGGDVRGQISSS